MENNGARSITRLSDTFTYEMINKQNILTNKMKNFVEKSVRVRPEQMIEELGSIKRYFKYPLVTDVLEGVEDGTIQARMFPPTLATGNKLPLFIPFVLVGAPGGRILPLAAIDNYVSYDKTNDMITMDPKKLYILLEGAYIAARVQKLFPKMNNTVLYTDGALIFAHMFARVLNKKFALNVEKTAFGKILYVAVKYYFINILRVKDSPMVDNYALRISGLSNIVVKEVDEAFKEKPDTFNNIGTFISRIAETSYLFTHGLKDLTTRAYVQWFLDMYGSSTLFALEHFSYFIFHVFSAVNGGFMNNQYAFDEIVGVSGEKLYAYVANFVK